MYSGSPLSWPSARHFIACVIVLPAVSSAVRAIHAISFANNCGYGMPTLDLPPSNTLATGTGTNVYQNATILNSVAFLNTGFCGPNGGNCTTLDISLGLSNGSSQAVVDLIPTHVFSVPISFTFYNACQGAGVSCLTSDCVNAVRQPEETSGLVICPAASDPNSAASLLVTFCPNFGPSSSSSSISAAPSSTRSSSASASHPSRAALVGGVVGSISALFILGIAATLFVCFRRRAKKVRKAQQELELSTRPFPYPDDPFATPARSLKSFNKTASDTTPAYSPLSATGPQSPPRAHAQSSSVSGSEADLDGIVERLASRFGWTAPPPGNSEAAAPTVHHDANALPMYRDSI